LPFELYANTFMPRCQISDELYKLVGQMSPGATPELPLTSAIQEHKDSLLKVEILMTHQEHIFFRTSLRSF